MTFALASVTRHGQTAPCLRIDGRYWPLAPAAAHVGVDLPKTTLAGLFMDWEAQKEPIFRLARTIAAGELPASLAWGADEVQLELPLAYPRKVFCTGANYADHLAEMGATIEKVEGRAPFFYMKPATTSLTGPGPSVFLPPGCQNFDWEVEVVIVFGRGGRHIPAESALSHIAGYTLGIDFTARDQFLAPHLPFQYDFILGKCQDRTAPVGPVVVPKEFVNVEDIGFSLAVNGAEKQRSTTAKMIYTLAEQIAGISKVVTIEAGDIMFTGSPAGVGAPRGERLKAGDVVVVESVLTGPMEVVIQAPDTAVRV